MVAVPGLIGRQLRRRHPPLDGVERDLVQLLELGLQGRVTGVPVVAVVVAAGVALGQRKKDS